MNDFERELLALGVIFLIMVFFDKGWLVGLALLVVLLTNRKEERL